MVATPRKPVVLVVDDEHGIRDIIRSEVESEGFEVREAANGVEALAAVEAHGIDVIISDLSMPKMGGLELLTQLRKNHWLYPFIIVTGYGSEKSALEALRLGAFDFLNKPFDTDILLKLVHEGTEVAMAMREIIERDSAKLGSSNATHRAMAMIGKLRAMVSQKNRKGGAA